MNDNRVLNHKYDKRTNKMRALMFIVVTFILNWAMAFAFYGMGGGGRIPTLILGVAYMFVPMTVALILQKLVYREGVRGLGVSWKLNRWFLVAWLLPVAAAIATTGVSLLIPGLHFDPAMSGMFERFKGLLTPDQVAQMREQIKAMPVHPYWLGIFQGLIAGVTINAVAAFGEELGWRGYLQKYLGHMGFWKSSLLVGFIWGVWHAPLILHGHNYPQHPQVGVLMMTGWTMLLAPIFSYVRLRAGSVIAAAVIHGSINATAGLAIMVIRGGNDLTTGLTGLPGFIVLALINIGIFLHDRYVAREKAVSVEV